MSLGRIADARLAEDQHQIAQIVAAALTCWGHVSRKLLLSERTDHITAIAGALEAWPPDAPRIVLATLLLAMPVSWKGTLQQRMWERRLRG